MLCLTFIGQLTPSHQPGNNRPSFTFSNLENPLTLLPHIAPSLSPPVPSNSSKKKILGRLIYFLEQYSIFSLVQAGFRPGRSTVDQVLLLSQSIADSFYQSKPGAHTVLATVDFEKTFDPVWHSAFLSKLLSLGLPLCFVEWIRSYLSDRPFNNPHL